MTINTSVLLTASLIQLSGADDTPQFISLSSESGPNLMNNVMHQSNTIGSGVLKLSSVFDPLIPSDGIQTVTMISLSGPNLMSKIIHQTGTVKVRSLLTSPLLDLNSSSSLGQAGSMTSITQYWG